MNNLSKIKELTSMLELVVPKPISDEMFAHARAGLPNETCGYLAGKDLTVSQFYKMRNVDESPEHFSFDPQEQFHVVKTARAEGLSLIAVYHSHPETPARLSSEDIRLFNDPKMVYIIVSLMMGYEAMNAYRVEKPSEHDVVITRLKILTK